MLLGFFFLRPIPLREQTSSRSLEDGDDVRETLLPAVQHQNYSTARTEIDTDGEHSDAVGCVVEATDSIQASGQKFSALLNIHGKALWSNLDFWLLFIIYSMRMFSFLQSFLSNQYHKDSLWDWLYMYAFNFFNIPTETMIVPPFCPDINNVGSMSRSLYSHNNPKYDDAQAVRWQAAQVSAISLTNFGGRFLIGTVHVFSLIPLLLNFSNSNRLLFGLG